MDLSGGQKGLLDPALCMHGDGFSVKQTENEFSDTNLKLLRNFIDVSTEYFSHHHGESEVQKHQPCTTKNALPQRSKVSEDCPSPLLINMPSNLQPRTQGGQSSLTFDL